MDGITAITEGITAITDGITAITDGIAAITDGITVITGGARNGSRAFPQTARTCGRRGAPGRSALVLTTLASTAPLSI